MLKVGLTGYQEFGVGLGEAEKKAALEGWGENILGNKMQ